MLNNVSLWCGGCTCTYIVCGYTLKEKYNAHADLQTGYYCVDLDRMYRSVSHFTFGRNIKRLSQRLYELTHQLRNVGCSGYLMAFRCQFKHRRIRSHTVLVSYLKSATCGTWIGTSM